MINRAVLDACDKIDGLGDAIIDDPRKCKFDPATIACRRSDSADCLTAPQVAALKKIYQGPKNPRTGETIFPGMYVGSEVNPLGLDRTLANAPGFGPAASGAGPGDLDELERAGLRLGQGRDDGRQRAVAGARRRGSGSDGVQAARRQAAALHRLGRPADSGGRPRELLRGMQKKMGGAPATAEFARLFMVPGMGHCAGGTSPNRFDALARAGAVGRKRNGAREDDRLAGGAGRHGANAAVVSVSAGREVGNGDPGEFRRHAANFRLAKGI